LHDYFPDGNAPLIAHMLAVTGYAEVMLAENFCSGIPLSTLDYGGDYTYRAGSTTQDVLTHAIALFDSAATMAGDSARIKNLAIVGKARAQLQLGQFDEAAATVASIPVDYRYTLMYNTTAGVPGLGGTPTTTVPFPAAAQDREGQNGLPFMSEPDGRLPAFVASTQAPIFYYPVIPAVSSIVLASGVEAQLIRAEAALHGDDPAWLTMLNALRTDGTYTVSGTDTTWNAGTGGVADLAPLTDPALDPLPTGKTAMDVRIDLLFRERAYWLYLTGHRQSDLRRLVSVYLRDPESVYPTGNRLDGTVYGSDLTFPVPVTEIQLNPLYNGCLNRDA
jgi:hypothetical protein